MHWLILALQRKKSNKHAGDHAFSAHIAHIELAARPLAILIDYRHGWLSGHLLAYLSRGNY